MKRQRLYTLTHAELNELNRHLKDTMERVEFVPITMCLARRSVLCIKPMGRFDYA
jgi:hypothetical protein